MEIVAIFGKRLFAFKYPNETKDEFSRLFDLWNDNEYLEEFFETHISDLQSGYWYNTSVVEAVFDTIKYAQQFEDVLYELSENNEESQIDGLESMFRPLFNSSHQFWTFNKSKARDNWLRLYALRIERDIYIITGGANKLTQKMQDRRHTSEELSKLEKCRSYLLNAGVVDVDGLMEEMES